MESRCHGTRENTEDSNTDYENIKSNEMPTDLSHVQNVNSEDNDDGYMEPVNARNPVYQALCHREAEMNTPYAVLGQNSFKILSATDLDRETN